MFTPDDHVRLAAAQDQLVDLLVQQDEASRVKDWPLVGALEKQIDAARTRRDKLRRPQ
jgi:hypothetical protein